MLSFIAFILLFQNQPAQSPGIQATESPTVQAGTPASPADVPTPMDPKERLELAAKVNGLAGLNVPWHLKATWQLFGSDGKPSDTGTYEEWRVSAHQYRTALHSPSMSHEEFGTDNGTFTTGDHGWIGRPFSSIRWQIENPISLPRNLDQTKLTNFNQTFGTGKAPCTSLPERSLEENARNLESYCFAPANAILLYASAPGRTTEVLFHQISSAHGHYFGRDIQFVILGQPWLNMHIDTLEGLSPAGMNALRVPADARPMETPEAMRGDIVPGRLIKKVVPEYPAEAKRAGVQGTVIVSGIVRKDGHLAQLQVLGGPQMLWQAASDCVRQWVFTPFLLEGKPVDVEADFYVNFKMQQ
jgi:TonB family protein